MELEIDAGAEQRLDFAAGSGADFLELGAAFADEDGFLPVALTINGGGDAGERVSEPLGDERVGE